MLSSWRLLIHILKPVFKGWDSVSDTLWFASELFSGDSCCPSGWQLPQVCQCGDPPRLGRCLASSTFQRRGASVCPCRACRRPWGCHDCCLPECPGGALCLSAAAGWSRHRIGSSRAERLPAKLSHAGAARWWPRGDGCSDCIWLCNGVCIPALARCCGLREAGHSQIWLWHGNDICVWQVQGHGRPSGDLENKRMLSYQTLCLERRQPFSAAAARKF